MKETWRRTTQRLLPARAAPSPAGEYDLYPAHPLPAEQIELGYDALARRLSATRTAVIDGYGGIFWSQLRRRLHKALQALGVAVHWVDAAARAGDVPLQNAFDAFGHDLGSFLKKYVVTFQADLVLVLGGIARAYDLFGPALEAEVDVTVKEGQLGASAALLGVAAEL